MAPRITKQEQEVIKEMRMQGYGAKVISERLGRTRKTVQRQFSILGLPTKLEDVGIKRFQEVKTNGKCRNCNKHYKSRRVNAKFCSDECRGAYNRKYRGNNRECPCCKSTFKTYSTNKVYCSNECRITHKTAQRNAKRTIVIKRWECFYCNKIHYGKRVKKFCNSDCAHKSSYKSKARIHTIKCKECGKHKEVTYRRKVFCSDECNRKYEWRRKEVKRRKKIKANGEVHWDISIERLLKRDGSTCYLCGENTIKGEDTNHELYPSIEHVIPIAKGGTHTWDNVKIAHRRCNWEKRDDIIESL